MTDMVIRPTTDADVQGVIALIEERIGEEDAPEARLVLEDPGFDRRRWSVAVDGDRVVSTMATFPMTLWYGAATIPAAMMEFVATDERYESRGLIRRQFDYHHADLAARGELFQVIVGIPYFYRRFGYEYALPGPGWRTIAVADIPKPPEGWSTRSADEADIETLHDLQVQARTAASVSIGFSNDLWRFTVASSAYTTLLAERDGVAEGCGRLYVWDDKPYVLDLAGSGRAALDAILAEVTRRCPDQDVTVLDRPGIRPLLDGLGTAKRSGDAYYARVGDPTAFLNAARPELTRRLGDSDLAEAQGTGLISLFSSSMTFPYANGEVGEFAPGGVVQAPTSKGGSGVAADRFVSLLVGPDGFSGLAERNPDVYSGDQRGLMEALFPPQVSDVQSWTIP